MSHWSSDLREAFNAGRQTDLTFEAWLESTDHAGIEELNLPVRAYKALRRNYVTTIGEARWLLSGGAEGVSLLDFHGIGRKTYEEACACLKEWDGRVRS